MNEAVVTGNPGGVIRDGYVATQKAPVRQIAVKNGNDRQDKCEIAGVIDNGPGALGTLFGDCRQAFKGRSGLSIKELGGTL